MPLPQRRAFRQLYCTVNSMKLHFRAGAISIGLCAALSFLLPATAIAQDDDLPPKTAPTSANAPVEGLIKLDVVVTGHAGIPVTDLGQKDFSLLDNGQPAKIRSFHAFNSEFPRGPIRRWKSSSCLTSSSYPPTSLPENAMPWWLSFGRTAAISPSPSPSTPWRSTGLWLLADPSTDGNALATQVTENHQLHLAGRLRGSAEGTSLGLRNSRIRQCLQVAAGARQHCDCCTAEARQKTSPLDRPRLGSRKRSIRGRHLNTRPNLLYRSMVLHASAGSSHHALQLLRWRNGISR